MSSTQMIRKKGGEEGREKQQGVANGISIHPPTSPYDSSKASPIKGGRLLVQSRPPWGSSSTPSIPSPRANKALVAHPPSSAIPISSPSKSPYAPPPSSGATSSTKRSPFVNNGGRVGGAPVRARRKLFHNAHDVNGPYTTSLAKAASSALPSQQQQQQHSTSRLPQECILPPSSLSSNPSPSPSQVVLITNKSSSSPNNSTATTPTKKRQAGRSSSPSSGPPAITPSPPLLPASSSLQKKGGKNATGGTATQNKKQELSPKEVQVNNRFLQQEVERLDQLALQAMEARDANQAEAQALWMALEEKEENLKRLTSELQNARTLAGMLEEVKKGAVHSLQSCLENENKHLAKRLIQRENETRHLRESCSAATNECLTLSTALHAARVQSSQRSSEVRTLTREKAGLAAGLTAARTERKRLTVVLKRKEEELMEHQVRCETLEKQRQEAMKHVQVATEEAFRLGSELRAIQKERDNLAAGLVTPESEQARLQAILKKRESTIEMLKGRYETFKNERIEALARVSDAREEAGRLAYQEQCLRKEVASLSRKLEAAQNEASRLSVKLKAWEDDAEKGGGGGPIPIMTVMSTTNMMSREAKKRKPSEGGGASVKAMMALQHANKKAMENKGAHLKAAAEEVSRLVGEKASLIAGLSAAKSENVRLAGLLANASKDSKEMRELQAKYDAMNREMHVKNYKMVELEAELLSAKRAAQIAVDMASEMVEVKKAAAQAIAEVTSFSPRRSGGGSSRGTNSPAPSTTSTASLLSPQPFSAVSRPARSLRASSSPLLAPSSSSAGTQQGPSSSNRYQPYPPSSSSSSRTSTCSPPPTVTIRLNQPDSKARGAAGGGGPGRELPKPSSVQLAIERLTEEERMREMMGDMLSVSPGEGFRDRDDDEDEEDERATAAEVQPSRRVRRTAHSFASSSSSGSSANNEQEQEEDEDDEDDEVVLSATSQIPCSTVALHQVEEARVHRRRMEDEFDEEEEDRSVSSSPDPFAEEEDHHHHPRGHDVGGGMTMETVAVEEDEDEGDELTGHNYRHDQAKGSNTRVLITLASMGVAAFGVGFAFYQSYSDQIM